MAQPKPISALLVPELKKVLLDIYDITPEKSVNKPELVTMLNNVMDKDHNCLLCCGPCDPDVHTFTPEEYFNIPPKEDFAVSLAALYKSHNLMADLPVGKASTSFIPDSAGLSPVELLTVLSWQLSHQGDTATDTQETLSTENQHLQGILPSADQDTSGSVDADDVINVARGNNPTSQIITLMLQQQQSTAAVIGDDDAAGTGKQCQTASHHH